MGSWSRIREIWYWSAIHCSAARPTGKPLSTSRVPASDAPMISSRRGCLMSIAKTVGQISLHCDVNERGYARIEVRGGDQHTHSFSRPSHANDCMSCKVLHRSILPNELWNQHLDLVSNFCAQVQCLHGFSKQVEPTPDAALCRLIWLLLLFASDSLWLPPSFILIPSLPVCIPLLASHLAGSDHAHAAPSLFLLPDRHLVPSPPWTGTWAHSCEGVSMPSFCHLEIVSSYFSMSGTMKRRTWDPRMYTRSRCVTRPSRCVTLMFSSWQFMLSSAIVFH